MRLPAHAFILLACSLATPYSIAQTASTVTLKGRVVDDATSAPLHSVELRFRPPGARILTADIETDSEGKFVAPEMPVGSYNVTASANSYEPVNFSLTVPVGPVTVRLTRYGVITGKIMNAAGVPLPERVLAGGGRQAGGAQVVVLTKTSDTGELTVFRQQFNMGGADGVYRLENLPPGDYAVGLWYSAIDEGAGIQIYPDNAHPRIFSIHGGEEFTGIDFRVNPHPSSRVSGKIEIPEGARGQYWVSLGLPGRFRIPLATVQAGSDGAFQFDKIPLGSYDVFVAGPAAGRLGTIGMADAGTPLLFGRAQVQVAGQDVENLNIPVHPGKTLNVLLHSAAPGNTGCPLSSEVSANSPEPWPVMMQLRATANFQNPVALSNLPPGRLNLYLAPQDNCFAVGEIPEIDLSGDNSPQQVAIGAGPGGVMKGALNPAASGALVTLRSLKPPPAVSFTVRAYTSENGQFEFQKLMPGLYRIDSAGYRGQEIEVKAGSSSELSLVPTGQRSPQ